MVSGTLAEKMAEMWIVKGNPCEAGVDAHSILVASIARKKELTSDEFVYPNFEFPKFPESDSVFATLLQSRAGFAE
jgi:hypothetical protein